MSTTPVDSPSSNQSDSSKKRDDSLLGSAGAMGAATMMSRVMGLVREQVFAYFFGASNLTDAFQVAFRIPNLLRDLFAEGAMSAALVPTFTRTREEEGSRSAWRVAGLVFRVLFLVVSLLSILGAIFAPELVGLYAEAFKEVPGKFELTVLMTRIMFGFFPFVALAAGFMAVLNSCGVFFVPAFASALFNVSSVVVGLLAVYVFQSGSGWQLQPIVGMAIGVVAGGIVQAFSQLPFLYRAGYYWPKRQAKDPDWWKDPRLRRMLAMLIPGTLGLAATQVNILVNTILATSQGSGAVSWLNYAFRLMQFPIGVFGVSLAAATLPRLARFWVNKDYQNLNHSLEKSLRSVFAVNLPASVGLAVMGYPIIEMIFEYGRFYREDARATAVALAMYSLGLSGYSAVKVLVPACYAIGRTRSAVFSSVITVLVTIVINLVLIRTMGYAGLALGTSIGALFNAIYLLRVVQRRLAQVEQSLRFSVLAKVFFQYVFVSMVMGLICWAGNTFLRAEFSDSWFISHLGPWALVLGRVLRVTTMVSVGVLVVVGLGRVFRLQEILEVLEIFTGKFKNRLGRKSL